MKEEESYEIGLDDGNTMCTPMTSIKVALTFRIVTKSHGIQRKTSRFPMYCELTTRRHDPVIKLEKKQIIHFESCIELMLPVIGVKYITFLMGCGTIPKVWKYIFKKYIY